MKNRVKEYLAGAQSEVGEDAEELAGDVTEERQGRLRARREHINRTEEIQ